MDQEKKALSKAVPVEPRHDRLLAVLLEGVLDLEMTAARQALERSSAPPRLVERALSLLRQESVVQGFLNSPVEPEAHLASASAHRVPPKRHR